MHDQIRVALDLHCPAAVVVDAVAVERERGEAEEEHGIGRDAAAPRDVRGRVLAAGSLITLARLDLLAEHGTALLLDGQPARAEDAVDRGGEHESAGAAGLGGDVRQLGLATKRVADPDGLVEAEALAGEHAARQGHGGHHAGVAGAPILAELARAEARQPVEDVPARRQRIALDELALGPPEGQPQEVGGRGGDDVRGLLAPPDMRLQPVEIQRGVRHAEDTSTGPPHPALSPFGGEGLVRPLSPEGRGQGEGR